MTIVAVLLGGAAGTALRLLADVLVPAPAGGIPYSTLAVNVLGSFLLGAAVARLWPGMPPWARAGLGTGLLGSFTTFSAVALVVDELARDGSIVVALAYLAASLVGGLVAALLGLRLARRPEPIGPAE